MKILKLLVAIFELIRCTKEENTSIIDLGFTPNPHTLPSELSGMMKMLEGNDG